MKHFTLSFKIAANSLYISLCVQIQLMSASVAIVIVNDEKNISLSWTDGFPPVLLTDELAASNDQTYSKCNNLGRVAVKGMTCYR